MLKRGKYHEANQIAYVHIGTVHDYQNGFNDKYLICFPFFFFFECLDVISKSGERPQVEMLKLVFSFYAHLFYFGATFSFAEKGKNIGVYIANIANRNFGGYPECVMET